MLINSLVVARGAEVTQVPHVRLALIITQGKVLGVRAEAEAQGVLEDTDGMSRWEVLIGREGAADPGMNKSHRILFPLGADS